TESLLLLGIGVREVFKGMFLEFLIASVQYLSKSNGSTAVGFISSGSKAAVATALYVLSSILISTVHRKKPGSAIGFPNIFAWPLVNFTFPFLLGCIFSGPIV